MEPYTLDRNFRKQDIIDNFYSLIWTERYYGDGNIEIVVPSTEEMKTKIPAGTFISIPESKEIMMIENRSFDEPNKMKLSGKSLTPWLNERFVRTSSRHEDRYWYIEGKKPGEILGFIVEQMCVAGSSYLNGTIDIGIPDANLLVIPGLEIGSLDSSGDNVNIGVPFGPVYNALREIAVTYEIGMRLILDEVSDSSYTLKFESYKGLNRTTLQTVNSIVRFSPQVDSFTNIKELESIAVRKTKAYVFAPANPEELAVAPGQSSLSETLTGFDLRAMLIFADDVTTDMVAGDATSLVDILNSRANDALAANRSIKAIDGEIVPDNQLKYGIDYGLGDIVEVQGNSGLVQTAQVIEYIRSQDATGKKSYPTVTMLGEEIIGPRPPNDDWQKAQTFSCPPLFVGNIPNPALIRYVDFENGNDDNDGLTKETAWLSIHGGGSNDMYSNGPFHSIDHDDIPQFGPGWTYRLRGAYQYGPMFLDTEEYPDLKGTAENPCVFESWHNKLDRAVLGGSGYASIDTRSADDPDRGGPLDDHHVIFRGFDLISDTAIEGNYTTFEDCKITTEDYYGINGYGDYLILDRCLINVKSGYNGIYWTGGYLTIKNCIIQGLNYYGEAFPDRNSDLWYESDGPTSPWYFTLRPKVSETRPMLTFVYNTITGMGGPDSSMNGLGEYWTDYPYDWTTDYIIEDDIVIQNNIFADVRCYEDPTSGIWNFRDELNSVLIQNNLFSNDVIEFEHASFYKNLYDLELTNITFDPDTDIFADPKFISPSSGNYRLNDDSPAINAGSLNNASPYDYRRMLRYSDPDIGAFEFVNFSIPGTNRYATTQDIDNEFVSLTGTTVWYKITPEEDEVLTIIIQGRGKGPIVDPKLLVFEYTGIDIDPEELTETELITSGDSPITVNLRKDHHYYLQVDVDSVDNAGDFSLKTECEPLIFDWVLVSNAGPNLHYPSMAWDPDRGKIVLFGGFNNSESEYSDKTYTWEDDHWELLDIVGDPPGARYGASMAWDPIRQEMVLFGGSGFTSDDTWTLSGNTWTYKDVVDSPSSGFYGMGFAWSEADGMLLLVGDDNPNTWGWNGIEWTDLEPVDVPYDGAYEGRLVTDQNGTVWWIFGLDDNDLTFVSYWDSEEHTWVDVITPTTPTGTQRGGFACAFVPNIGIVIWGGYNYYSDDTRTAWIFSDNNWTELIKPTVPALLDSYIYGDGMAMVYNPLKHQLIMMGTSDSDHGTETWGLYIG